MRNFAVSASASTCSRSERRSNLTVVELAALMPAKLEIRNSKLAPNGESRIKDFTDLNAWKLARELRAKIYDLTKRFPSEEKHVLVAQIPRAALSVTSNIAEGFGRFSYHENLQFCRQARGSAFEVRDQLTAALDAGYLTTDSWKEIDTFAQRMIQVLNGYLRSTKELQAAPQATKRK